MGLLNKEEAKKILEKVVGYSKSDECVANLNGSIGGNIRYALNTVTTAGFQDNLSLGVTAVYGKKSGTATVNQFDDASLERCVRRAEEIAKLAPENPEYMSVLGPQKFDEHDMGWSEKTAASDAALRAKAAGDSIKPCRQKNLVAAGFLEDQGGFGATLNSKGLYTFYRETGVDFSVTVRTEDGAGSGWVNRDYNDISKLDTGAVSAIALEKAERSVEAKAIEPGRYTVVLEPAAAGDLLGRAWGSFNARSASEGRSFMSKKGGGTKIGDKIVDERINVTSDPRHPEVPFAAFTGDGRARKARTWIKDGVAQNLFYSRYWADKEGVEDAPSFPGSVVVAGGDASLEDLIKDTKKGILVTRLWYIRSVDPQTLLYTGLTRDGTFMIENGKIAYPIKNLRFNESPMIMLNNLEALGKQMRYNGSLYPSMKIRDFTFTSTSDAV